MGACGAIGCLIAGKKPHKFKGSIYFQLGGPSWGGCSIGPFFFVDSQTTYHVIKHEWGHSIQNIIFGPFHIFITIASLTRYWYRDIMMSTGRKTFRDLPPYDSIWFEGQATAFGTKYTTEEEYALSKPNII